MYQFIHIEDYSVNASKKKRTDMPYNKEIESKTGDIRGVIAEAKREPDNIPSTVKVVEDPILLYGVDLDTVEALASDYHKKTKIKDKNGKEKKLRNDANVLIAGIISLNRECEDFWDDYKQNAIEWLKNKYGERLKCVVEHTDEPNPHFHFYVIPREGERFEFIHDGRNAMLKNKDKLKREQNIAYKEAMRAFQEDFFINVSAQYGLTKDGPKRRRRSRADHFKIEREIKAVNKYAKKVKKENERLENEIKNLNKIIEDTKRNETIKVIRNFNNKNYFNKFIFSIKHTTEVFNENIKLKEKLIKSESRKNTVLSRMNKVQEENNKLNNEIKDFDYYKKLNMFLFNLDENLKPITINKENKNDTRNREFINREIDLLEKQQQQIDQRFKSINTKQRETKLRFTTIREKFDRIRDILHTNFKHTFRDLFSIDYFKRKFEEKRNEEIKTIEKIESQNRLTRESRKNEFTRKIKDF